MSNWKPAIVGNHDFELEMVQKQNEEVDLINFDEEVMEVKENPPTVLLHSMRKKADSEHMVKNEVENGKKLDLIQFDEEVMENPPIAKTVLSYSMRKKKDFENMVKNEVEKRKKLDQIVAESKSNMEEYEKCLENQGIQKLLGIVDNELDEAIINWESSLKKQQAEMVDILRSIAIHRQTFVTKYNATGTMRNRLLHDNVSNLLKIVQSYKKKPLASASNATSQELCVDDEIEPYGIEEQLIFVFLFLISILMIVVDVMSYMGY